MNDKMFKAGAYIRLSREDGNKYEESNSITNQRELIKQYLNGHNDITIYDYYSDDGKTGTNFDRPGFQRMLEDMYNKKIDCIIVKDLSRFGRNYIEVGRYIEYIFPSNNIRFISINDNIDSFLNPDSITNVIVPFKNLMNDEYCRDISRKIKKVKEIQRLSGEVTNGAYPYGYVIKDKQYVVDEEVRDIIRMIYDLSINGMSTTSIAFKLNELGINCPSNHFARHKNRETNLNKHWSSYNITTILKNSTYCGDLIQGKTTTLSHKVKVPVRIPKDKWVIIKDHHEPIIDRETFNKVQDSLKSRTYNRVICNTFPNLFKGYLKCYDCHKCMVRTSCIKYKDKEYVSYNCYTYIRESHDLCSNKKIPSEELNKVVLESFMNDLNILLDFEENILPNMTNTKELDEIDSKINELENRLSNINRLKNGVLLDLKKQLITKDDYFFYTSTYDNDSKDINKELNELKDKKFILTHEENIMKDFIKSMKKYQYIDRINETMLKDLVDTIYVKENKMVEIVYLDNDTFNQIKERSIYGTK